MRFSRERRPWRTVVLAALVLAALLYLPTPYLVMAPGDAVDLRAAVQIPGHRSPPDPLYLTDVLIYRASPLGLLSTLAPGYTLLPQSSFIPQGVSYDLYQQVLQRSMTESQQAAAVVAERAAGYHVATPATRVHVVSVMGTSKAAGLLAPGDAIVAADGKPIDSLSRLIAIVSRHKVGGPPVRLEVERQGKVRPVAVPTVTTPAGPRMGVLIASEPGQANLPVPVKFGGALRRISGSSGGLMMALDIYASLTGHSLAGVPIAGTGTIDYAGGVGPIDGAAQKVIAAKRAGAKIFLCPVDNYRQIAATPGIRVVPVATFRQALEVVAKAARTAA